MPSSPRRRARTGLVSLLAVALTQLPSVNLSPASAVPPAGEDQVGSIGDTVGGVPDIDTRGTTLPSALQRSAASALHASVRWNDFGTPASISSPTGTLGPATGSNPVAAARSWLMANRAVFGLSTAQVSGLELVNNQKLADSKARAVLFRQTFGDLSPAIGSMVTVGVAGERIVYVSSSLTKTTQAPPAATLSPVQGWLRAARSVGVNRAQSGILGVPVVAKGWTRFGVEGLAQPQLARQRALAMADGSVRPVVEANVVDVQGGSATAYTVLVDAVTGRVLQRQNQVKNSSDVFQFSGTITATDCGEKYPFTTTDDNTRQIVITASTLNPANDIVIKLYGPGGEVLSSADTGTSPETLTYTANSIPAGTYQAEVCPFPSPTVPFTPPGNYAGTVVTSDSGPPAADTPFPPVWKYFVANPVLNYSATRVAKNRVTGCWVTRYQGSKVDGCTKPPGVLDNIGAKVPWDFNVQSNSSTLTTTGNAASTREAWASPLTPGGTAQAPVSPERRYEPAFTDAWNNSKCDPSQLTPGGNDIEASVGNLFVAHNRLHDYGYYLGFTERNYNMQSNNFGQGGAEGDPEIGNAQAGALTGGSPSYLGRDNANQIALQDGVPGITNQYLFQPLPGAFYAPCADGGLDMSIVGHEYTHAISNRMIGGPDEGITSDQGGAMGESWGDLVASEYLLSNNYRTGTNPWAVGPYATGNKKTGIRNYALNRNPMNYGELGYDSVGNQVHADGEIWSGTMYSVRKALVRKYNARFPASNKALQKRCASGRPNASPLRSTRCPGNRRWIQLVFDSFLLQQGATSMLDARDAMLAADQMRYRGANQKVMWKAFAKRGFGVNARTKTANSGDPKAGFRTPKAKAPKVRFKAVTGKSRKAVAGKVYVGTWEARATPVADTIKKTKRNATTKMTPGRYRALFVSKGYGMTRFRLKVGPRKTVRKVVRVKKNLTSSAGGAKVVSSSAGSLNAASLIDDTESTNWAGVNESANVDETNPFVVIDLAGGKRKFRTARVSAMLRPAPASATDVPLAVQPVDDPDPDSGSRFTALRRFALEVCVKSKKNDCTSTDAKWKRVYKSKPNAFPSVRPRPVAPTLQLRTFKMKKAVRATHVRFVALENQCTGYKGYAGEQDNDPANATDCKTASDRGQSVRAAELELFR